MMTTTKEKEMIKKLEGCELYEVFDFCGTKKVFRMGFFSKVTGEAKPYAWYTHVEPISDIDNLYNDIMEDELKDIKIMSEEEILDKLSEMKKLTPMDVLDVSVHAPLGFYFGL